MDLWLGPIKFIYNNWRYVGPLRQFSRIKWAGAPHWNGVHMGLSQQFGVTDSELDFYVPHNNLWRVYRSGVSKAVKRTNSLVGEMPQLISRHRDVLEAESACNVLDHASQGETYMRQDGREIGAKLKVLVLRDLGGRSWTTGAL